MCTRKIHFKQNINSKRAQMYRTDFWTVRKRRGWSDLRKMAFKHV